MYTIYTTSETLIASGRHIYHFEFLTERPTLKPTDKEMVTMIKIQVSAAITHFRLFIARSAAGTVSAGASLFVLMTGFASSDIFSEKRQYAGR
jgi:hypothetical protein